MPITITATATANQALIGLFADIGGALSEIADIKNIELPNRATTTQLSNLSDNLNTVDAKADLIEERRLQNAFDNAAKFDSWDTKLQAEVSRINGVTEEIADIKPKTNRIFNWLGNALEVVDVVGFVADLIATSALAAAIANVGSNSEQRDEQLQIYIDELYQLLNQISNMNTEQFNQLVTLLNQVNQEIGTANNLGSQNATRLNYISDNVLDLQASLSSGVTTINFIKTDTETILNTQTQTQTQISDGFSGIPNQVCTALQNPLCNPIIDFDNTGNCNLQPVLNKIDDVLNKLSFSFSCGSNGYVYNSFFEVFSHLVCDSSDGGNGGNIDIDAIDLQPIIDKIELKGNEIIRKIDEIPEPTLYVPDEWSIKLEGDRPQLIAGMQDAKMAGKGSASKWGIVIPHPKTEALSLSWEELASYFPDYTRGSWAAIAKLNDGSVARVRANTKFNAEMYLTRMLELVKPSLTNDDPYLYQYNQKFKEVKITCRGIAYYATGRKKGEKPTKRWYYPTGNDPV